MAKFVICTLFLIAVSTSFAAPLSMNNLLQAFQAAKSKIEFNLHALAGKSFAEVKPLMAPSLNQLSVGYLNNAKKLKNIADSLRNLSESVSITPSEQQAAEENINQIANGFASLAVADSKIGQSLAGYFNILSSNSNAVPSSLVAGFHAAEASVAGIFKQMANSYIKLSAIFGNVAARTEGAESQQWTEISQGCQSNGATFTNAFGFTNAIVNRLLTNPPKTVGQLFQVFIQEVSNIGNIYSSLN